MRIVTSLTRRRARRNSLRKQTRSSSRREVPPAIELLETRTLLTQLTVTSLDDNLDSGDGQVTLREALIAANTDGLTDANEQADGADTIVFAPDLNGVISLNPAFGQLVIDSEVSILGDDYERVQIVSSGSSRLLKVNSGALAVVTGLTLEGGNAAAETEQTGGAIHNAGDLAVRFSEVRFNQAPLTGGAIYSTGNLTLESVFVGQNFAGSGGGGLFLDTDSTTTIRNSTLELNVSDSDGGGVLSQGELLIVNSTLSGNGAAGSGGGLFTASGSTRLTNVTIATNFADNDADGSGSGGGITHTDDGVTQLVMNNTLIVGNLNSDPGATATPDEISYATGSGFDFANSDNNLVADPASAGGLTHGLRGNIVGDGQGSRLPTSTVIHDADFLGGLAPAHSLPEGSPAIDAGSNSRAAVDTVDPLQSDQRGLPFRRVSGARVDIGAFEVQPSPVLIVSSTQNVDDFDLSTLTLVEAVRVANESPGHDVIRFSGRLSAVFDIVFSIDRPLVLEDHVTIEGAGSGQTTIFADQQTRIFEIPDGVDVELRGLRLSGGQATSDESPLIEGLGGAIYNAGNLTLHDVFASGGASNAGGGIYNDAVGTLTTFDSTLRGSADNLGGALFNQGTVTLARTVISGGAPTGAGIVNDGGNVTVLDSEIVSNEATVSAAGGINRNSGTLTIRRSLVQDNVIQPPSGFGTSTKAGAFLNESGATLNIEETWVDRNQARIASFAEGTPTAVGGAVVNEGGTVNITRSTVSNNFAEDQGGGVYNAAGGVVNILSSTFSGNGLIVEQDSAAVTTAGGAIYNTVGSDLDIQDSTLTSNHARISGPGIHNQGEILLLNNTILAGNTRDAQADADYTSDSSMGEGRAFNNFFNIFGRSAEYHPDDLFAASNIFTIDENFNVTPLQLSHLQNNGGATPTHLPLAGSPAIDNGFSRTQFLDQRGFPLVDITGFGNDGDRFRDIGAVEAQSFIFSNFTSRTVENSSQFGPGEATVIGIGFDPEKDDAGFLGLELDPEPFQIGGIAATSLGEFGAEVFADVNGRFGLEYGYYFNSGTVEASIDGLLSYNITKRESDGALLLTAYPIVEDGSLYTVSPRFGAYVDLVAEFNADVYAKAAFVGSTETEFSVNFDERFTLFSVNRPVEGGGPNDLDGEIQFLGSNALTEALADGTMQGAKAVQDALTDRRNAEIDMREAEKELRRAVTEDERQIARDAISDAQGRIDAADAKERDATDSGKRKKSFGGINAGPISLDLEEADGPLLGLQATLGLGVGAGAGPASVGISKELGSLALTVPDVQLTADGVGPGGVITATTDDFEEGSLLDQKRQIAAVERDLAALTGVGGTTDIDLGPIGISLQTVSYKLLGTLNANQHAMLVPDVERIAYQFNEGTVVQNTSGMTLTPDADGFISVAPGEQLTIMPPDGDDLEVTPKVKLSNRFTNDIGLDIDLDGIFEALSFSLSAFGSTLIDAGPLIGPHRNDLAEYDFGSVFKTTFDLSTVEDVLETFVIDTASIGGDSALGSTLIDGSVTVTPAPLDEPTFIEVPVIKDNVSYGQIEFSLDGGMLDRVGALSDGWMFESLDGDGEVTQSFGLDKGGFRFPQQTARFRLIAPEIQSFGDDIQAGFAFGIDGSGDVTITSTLQDPTPVNVQMPELAAPTAEINFDRIEQQNGVYVEEDGRFDIDGNGVISALTDGILVNRYITGLRGADLIADAIGEEAQRTTATQIETYLRNLISGGVLNRLDADDDGVVTPGVDGLLIFRHLGGLTDGALTTGIVLNGDRSSPVDISDFLGGERDHALRTQGFNPTDDTLTLDTTARLETRIAASRHAVRGSSAWVPIEHVLDGGTGNLQFTLATFGNAVTFEDLFLKDASNSVDREQWELLGTTAEGSPHAVPNIQTDGSLTQEEVEDRLEAENREALLGTEEPIVIGLPDAEGYTVTAGGGAMVESLHFDRLGGGNAFLNRELDVFVPSTGEWFAIAMDDEPSFVFETPVAAFEIYGRRFPSHSLDRNSRLIARDVRLSLGLQLSGASDTTVITAQPVGQSPRADFTSPEPFTVSGIEAVNEFRITRDRENVEVRLNGNIQQAVVDGVTQSRIPQISTQRLRFNGNPTSADTLVIDPATGSIAMPIEFDGADSSGNGLMDRLILEGRDRTLDLTSEVSIVGVEEVDIRGSGANVLFVDLAAVQNNLQSMSLVVRADGDDTINHDGGWTQSGTETIDSVMFAVYTRDGATLKVEQGSTVQVGSPERESIAPLMRIARPEIDPAGPIQQVTGSPTIPIAEQGQTFSVDIHHAVLNHGASAPNGLLLQLHYDSSRVQFDGVQNVLADGFAGSQDMPETTLDGDPATDRVITVLWVKPTGTWQASDTKLLTANFTALQNAVSTDVSLTATPANGYQFSGVLEASGDPGTEDFGDAPDTTVGVGAGDYQTLASRNGPRHLVVPGLHLGAGVDIDDGTQQNQTATADDQFAIDGSDDEDGVLSPLDLQAAVGTTPTVTLLVTNTTGSVATLSGWIDYNRDGVFDNDTERAQLPVPGGISDSRFTLTFPTIPANSGGTTYARFRLSTDPAAAHPVGSAMDGEVEDYQFDVTSVVTGRASVEQKISDGRLTGLLSDGDFFGGAVTAIGDVDGDGTGDLAVSAYGDNGGGTNRGAVHVLLMSASGFPRSVVTLDDSVMTDSGGLDDGDLFGSDIASLGDIDGDGVPDLAVGARGDDDGGDGRGAIWIVRLNSDGTAKSTAKISQTSGGFGGTLHDDGRFGRSVAALGDLDGDGVTDLAVGAERGDDGGTRRGEVWNLLLNADGSVKSSTKISHSTNGGPALDNAD
jgi:hypothetical protein